MRNDFYAVDGVIIKNNKILIPKQLRREVLESLHSAHQGVTGMTSNARQRLFWPGLDSQLRLIRSQCKDCNDVTPSNAREPMTEAPLPTFPFELTVTDFFDHKGFLYLIYADRYTGWVETSLMLNGKESNVCNELRRWFMTYGAPTELSSDGGPPFDSQEYKSFLQRWGIKRRLSSAYYPQSNGRAELAVKSAKRILMDNTDSFGRLNHDKTARAFLTHRNTPVQGVGLSPAQMLYGRPIRDFLPMLLTTMKVSPQWKDIREKREVAMAKRHIINKARYDTHSRSLDPLQVGDSVLIQNQTGPYPNRWHKTGRIVECLTNRQYHVKVDGSNRVTLRNRRFLRQIEPVADIQPYREHCFDVKTDTPLLEQMAPTDSQPINDAPLENILDTRHDLPDYQVTSDGTNEAEIPMSSFTPEEPAPRNESPNEPIIPLRPASPESAPLNRRSTCMKRPPARLIVKKTGKHHLESTDFSDPPVSTARWRGACRD